MDHTKLIQLQTELSTLESEGADSVPLAKVKEMIAALRSAFGSDDDDGTTTAEIYSEIGQLALFLNEAKKEMSDVGRDDTSKNFGEASTQLDAILSTTEEATNTIMSEAEAVMGLSDDPEISDRMMKIIEACNFQDITGQRIQRVLKTFQKVEMMVLRMLVLFGGENKADINEHTREDLLNGPALEGAGGLEQDQIDDLLGNLLGDNDTHA